MAVIAAVVTIVVATPKYAEPAIGAAALPLETSPSASPSPGITVAQGPISKAPEKLRGYRWPLRGGEVVAYYDWDRNGFLTINGRRIHEGLSFSWFKGAIVKAAHKGTVVAAGRDWAAQVGFEDPMYRVIRRLSKKSRSKRMPVGVVIDDDNGYRSVITNLKELRVKPGDSVKAGQPIGEMATNCCIRYELVRMDGEWMRVAQAFVKRDGYPKYARERVDPLRVFNLEANKAPKMVKRRPPSHPPRIE
jgi:murein DD-endopeptidase MepM/ murein hydrolase activator NlpD